MSDQRSIEVGRWIKHKSTFDERPPFGGETFDQDQDFQRLDTALAKAKALAELPQTNYAKMKTLMRQDAIEQIRRSMG